MLCHINKEMLEMVFSDIPRIAKLTIYRHTA